MANDNADCTSEPVLEWFEEWVLLAVCGQEPIATHNRIRQALIDARGTDASTGFLYSTVRNLVARELLMISMIPAIPERGGRAKQSLFVTEAGLRALNALANRRRLISGASGSDVQQARFGSHVPSGAKNSRCAVCGLAMDYWKLWLCRKT